MKCSIDFAVRYDALRHCMTYWTSLLDKKYFNKWRYFKPTTTLHMHFMITHYYVGQLFLKMYTSGLIDGCIPLWVYTGIQCYLYLKTHLIFHLV